ncbi:MAG: MerR family transcriptional regulator [Patescibacteria group bacterium]|nr:MerR family transcriptional regulator [Patescibacteria group bacterium]
MTTSEVARIVGVEPETLLGWCKTKKWLKEPKRDAKGWRVWSQEDIEAAKAVFMSKHGFSRTGIP